MVVAPLASGLATVATEEGNEGQSAVGAWLSSGQSMALLEGLLVEPYGTSMAAH